MKKLLIALFIIVGVGLPIYLAKAGPSSIWPSARTSTATTSVSYLTAGTATTTLVYDTYGISGTNQTNLGSTVATDSALLFVQLGASSTATVLNINVEYSNDGIDWFQDAGVLSENYATTTKPFDIGQVAQYKFTFASSTAGLPRIPSNQSTTTRAIRISTPTRFVRAVFTINIGAAAGNVWAEIVPKKENK